MGVIVILGAIAVVVLVTEPWKRAPPPPPPASLVVQDAGYVVTTGTQRCQPIVVEEWCDDIDPRLPNMTRTRAVKERVRTDDCAKDKRRRKKKDREDWLLDVACTATYRDLLADRCRSERLDFVPLEVVEREVRGRSLPAADSAPAPDTPPCGSPACGAGCVVAMEKRAAHVVFATKPDDGTSWRCPVELQAWNGAQPGAPFSARLSTCKQAPSASGPKGATP